MSNDKYYEKAKEIEKIFRKKKRIYKLARFGFIALAAIFYILGFTILKQYFLWLFLAGILATSIATASWRGDNGLVKWYNHQIETIEQLALEEELKSK